MRMKAKLISAAGGTWLFWVYGCCRGFISELSTISTRSDFVAAPAFALLVALWVSRDARLRERATGYDYPAFVFFLWPVFGPLYLFQTRGWRGFLSLLAFTTVLMIAHALGALIGAATRG